MNVEGTVFIPTGTKTSKVIPRVTSTDNAIVRFDGTTGAVQDSSVLIDDNGNLNITGTGKKITGDFSSVTDSNRLSFETSTPNSFTVVNSFPNGTGLLSAFRAFNTAQGLNSAFTEVYCNQTQSMIRAGRTGAGTPLPMTFNTGGVERIRIDTAGNVGIGEPIPTSKLHVNGNIRTACSSLDAINTRGFVFDIDGTIYGRQAIDNSSNLLYIGSGALGYGTGSGGVVTQLTNKNYNVSLNKPTGTIITSNSALVSGAGTSFIFLNSLLNINDTLAITSKGSINYDIDVIDIYNGAAEIRIYNRDYISHSDAISINFSIIKGAIS